jgi:ribokinase
MTSRVVVVGSINVDLTVTARHLPAPGETVTGGEFACHGGGKGANQAVAAARMGAEVELVAAVGDDEHGADALNDLRKEGVDVSEVLVRRGCPTGAAVIVVDAATGENQIAVAPGANATLRGDDVQRALALGEPAGVLLTGHEIAEDAVIAAAQAARRAGWTLVLNPAPARPIPDAVLTAMPILTPNAAEARALTGLDEPRRAAAALSSRTGAPVIITLGAGGTLLLDRRGSTQHLPAHAAAAIDTTGAGDALNGTLAAELARGQTIRAAVRLAMASAALTVQAAGARQGLPGRETVLPMPSTW